MNYRFKDAFRAIRRVFRFFFQRLFRGFDDRDTWSLFSSEARWMVPRMKRFIAIKKSHPIDMTDVEWNKTLGEILWMFEQDANDEMFSLDEDQMKRYFAAEDLYKEYRRDLWS